MENVYSFSKLHKADRGHSLGKMDSRQAGDGGDAPRMWVQADCPSLSSSRHCSRNRMLFIYNECVRNSPKLYWVEIYFLNREQGLPARAVLLFLALCFESPEYQAGRPFTMFIDLCFCA